MQLHVYNLHPVLWVTITLCLRGAAQVPWWLHIPPMGDLGAPSLCYSLPATHTIMGETHRCLPICRGKGPQLLHHTGRLHCPPQAETGMPVGWLTAAPLTSPVSSPIPMKEAQWLFFFHAALQAGSSFFSWQFLG